MHKSTRNITSVNGNPVDLQAVVDSCKVQIELLEQELEEARNVAVENYNVAEELGNVLAETQAKLTEAEKANGELQEKLKNITPSEEIIKAVKDVGGVFVENKVPESGEEALNQFVEVHKTVAKSSKKKKAEVDEQVSV